MFSRMVTILVCLALVSMAMVFQEVFRTEEAAELIRPVAEDQVRETTARYIHEKTQKFTRKPASIPPARELTPAPEPQYSDPMGEPSPQFNMDSPFAPVDLENVSLSQEKMDSFVERLEAIHHTPDPWLQKMMLKDFEMEVRHEKEIYGHHAFYVTILSEITAYSQSLQEE